MVRALRRATGVRKIGHAGTLDPLASGLMIMLIGEACKQADRFLKLHKTYVAQLSLGQESETGDSEGSLHKISAHKPQLEQIGQVLPAFTGVITQTPPIYSAIKVGGRRAYKTARQGETLEMPSRQVRIHKLKLLSYDYPALELECEVSSGTYIRTLAQDIGRALGVGAYLSALKRTQIGAYRLDQALPYEDLTAEQVEAKLLKV